jgi:CRISPR-associated protein Cst1
VGSIPGISLTGHPLVDVGFAVIAAFSGKDSLETIEEADLEEVAAYIRENYVVNPMKSFLTVAFPNSGFTNPSYEATPEKRVQYADRILYAWRTGEPATSERCVFTGLPAVQRAYRQHVPLLTGEGVINYFPYGDAGLPVSGIALLAIQACPLGCAKVRGRLLAVHSPSWPVMLYFAKTFLGDNRRGIVGARATGQSKLPEQDSRAGTLLLERLMDCYAAFSAPGGQAESVTAYHWTNSGQGAQLSIFQIPLEISRFVRHAMSAPYRTAWDGMRRRGWQIVQGVRGRSGSASGAPAYNVMYEDMLRLPDSASTFIRRYLLRMPGRSTRPGDPRGTYSIRADVDLISFSMTELFLREVMKVNPNRIELIRRFGDTIADHVLTENDRALFRNLLMASEYGHLRAVINKAGLERLKRGKPPLVDFDTYVAIFEEGEELAFGRWRLARDLVIIRVIERLHAEGWITAHAEELPELDVPADERTVS